MSELINSNFVTYLIELRRRLLQYLMVLLVVFIGLYFFADKLYQLLAIPLLNQLPYTSHLIATHIAAPFFVPLKFVAFLALFLTVPGLLYHLWAFTAPALYQHERRWLWLLLVASSGLFYLGIAFAFFVVFPLMFKFFVMIAPQGVVVMPDMASYLDFALKLFFAFGIAFQVPVLTVMSIKLGWVTAEQLEQKRPYIIVLAFVLGMLLTPPDVLSQVLLALPMWGLFEIGLVICKHMTKNNK
ncbi:MAG: twin-arginine protein translocation system subunit TatC [Gammaproteobacteria bacterium]|jgi:sec-independent protein translocase protein TatC|nr:twin-arginine protein translocation system subunit TatC [Gammaproteobacteria bacterium]